jgi:hypothetical protein
VSDLDLDAIERRAWATRAYDMGDTGMRRLLRDHAEAQGDVLALVVEVRRLRALPVIAIATCGDCTHHVQPSKPVEPGDYAWCGHEHAPGLESYDAKCEHGAPPPSWCPRRGKR